MHTILFVDTDDSVLKKLPKAARKKFELKRVDTYPQAVKVLKGKKDVAVLVVELGLNDEDAFVFLANCYRDFPGVVRMVYSASSEFTDALNALNTGHVFRFVKKPCPPGDMIKILAQCVRRHVRKTQDLKASRNTLIGSVKALVDILDLVNPEAMSVSKRIRSRVLDTGRALGVQPIWQLDLAVTLSHIGCVALPEEIIGKIDSGASLSPEEQQIYGMHPRIAANLLTNIDQMAGISEIIRYQLLPNHEKQPLGSRIIKTSLDLDRMIQKGAEPMKILKHMRAKDRVYDPKVVEAMLKLERKKHEAPEAQAVREICMAELKEGMVMAEDMINQEGTKLLLRGQSVTKASLVRLQSFYLALGVVEPLHVYADSPGPPAKCS